MKLLTENNCCSSVIFHFDFIAFAVRTTQMDWCVIKVISATHTCRNMYSIQHVCLLASASIFVLLFFLASTQPICDHGWELASRWFLQTPGCHGNTAAPLSVSISLILDCLWVQNKRQWGGGKKRHGRGQEWVKKIYLQQIKIAAGSLHSAVMMDFCKNGRALKIKQALTYTHTQRFLSYVLCACMC